MIPRSELRFRESGMTLVVIALILSLIVVFLLVFISPFAKTGTQIQGGDAALLDYSQPLDTAPGSGL